MLPSIPFDFPLAEAGLFEGVSEFVAAAEMEAFSRLIVADAGGDAFPEGDVLMV